ncbi:MAG: DUF3467 domain-containing protein [Bacillota bacterium]
MTEKDSPNDQISVSFPEESKGGNYANNMIVQHTQEEFILDFLMIAHPAGKVVSRIILSPGHIKRVVEALRINIEKYESKFGAIKAAEEPTGNYQM